MGGVYYVFFAKGGQSISALIKTSSNLPATADLSGRSDFLTTLLNIKNIKLDDTIFSSDAFKNLKDFSIQLVQDVKEGRPNPFAPLGIDEEVIPEDVSPVETGTFVEPGLEEAPPSDTNETSDTVIIESGTDTGTETETGTVTQ